MKLKKLLLFGTVILLLNACSQSKNMSAKNHFGNGNWELEYISGPRIAFEGLYPDRKPIITLNTKTKQVNGTNSCNGYSTKFSMEGESIKFAEPEITTMMYCAGEGDKVFLQTMSKVNKFNFDKDGKLQLLINEVPMMRFKKVN